MYILGNTWQGGYLDYHRPQQWVRIKVQAWWVLGRIEGLYIQPPRDWRLVWNYAKEVGLRALLSKIASRRKESLRNKKVLAIGLGTILEPRQTDESQTDNHAVFIAPCHPPCIERIALPRELTRSVDQSLVERMVVDRGVRFVDKVIADKQWDRIAGWDSHSGIPLPDNLDALLTDAVDRWRRLEVSETTILPLDEPTEPAERSTACERQTGQVNAVVFGLGNYAKAVILPNLDPRVSVTCVHEIDPTQIGRASAVPWSSDTCGTPRPDEQYQVYFIAGYHHTHTPLAIHALNEGAWAVVEKPLAVSWEQLDHLSDAMEQHPGRLFACFQLRYSRLWQYAIDDLCIKSGEAIHYHATAYEIPLPDRHWYRWPNSRSRVTSNACHWVDHFLFLNGFAEPERYDLWKAKTGDVHISIELANGGVFGLHLTDQGSNRIGLQDHIELRANGATVKVDNRSRYLSEDRRRILRTCRVNKAKAFSTMYRSICRKILTGEPGDDIRSVRATSQMVLKLEDAYGSS